MNQAGRVPDDGAGAVSQTGGLFTGVVSLRSLPLLLLPLRFEGWVWGGCGGRLPSRADGPGASPQAPPTAPPGCLPLPQHHGQPACGCDSNRSAHTLAPRNRSKWLRHSRLREFCSHGRLRSLTYISFWTGREAGLPAPWGQVRLAASSGARTAALCDPGCGLTSLGLRSPPSSRAEAGPLGSRIRGGPQGRLLVNFMTLAQPSL